MRIFLAKKSRFTEKLMRMIQVLTDLILPERSAVHDKDKKRDRSKSRAGRLGQHDKGEKVGDGGVGILRS
jgi:hypothetical protein